MDLGNLEVGGKYFDFDWCNRKPGAQCSYMAKLAISDSLPIRSWLEMETSAAFAQINLGN